MRLQIFSVENDLSAKNMAQATANSLYVGVSKHGEDIALSGSAVPSFWSCKTIIF